MPSVNRYVSLLFHMGERFLARELTDTGVVAATAPLLLELRDGGPRSPTGLASAIGVDKGHVSRLLKGLTRDGLVETTPDPRDGRMLVVALTRRGHEAAGVAEHAIATWLRIVGRGVSAEDLRLVDTVLDRFYDNAIRYFAEAGRSAAQGSGTAAQADSPRIRPRTRRSRH